MKVVVTALIKNPKGDKFLIVKRKSSSSIHPSKWSFPGGICNKQEDIIAALKREIFEETKLIAKDDFKQLSEYEYERPNKEITLGICFLCTSLSEHIALNTELESFKWITPKELSKFDHIPELEKEVRLAFKNEKVKDYN